MHQLQPARRPACRQSALDRHQRHFQIFPREYQCWQPPARPPRQLPLARRPVARQLQRIAELFDQPEIPPCGGGAYFKTVANAPGADPAAPAKHGNDPQEPLRLRVFRTAPAMDTVGHETSSSRNGRRLSAWNHGCARPTNSLSVGRVTVKEFRSQKATFSRLLFSDYMARIMPGASE